MVCIRCCCLVCCCIVDCGLWLFVIRRHDAGLAVAEAARQRPLAGGPLAAGRPAAFAVRAACSCRVSVFFFMHVYVFASDCVVQKQASVSVDVCAAMGVAAEGISHGSALIRVVLCCVVLLFIMSYWRLC